MIINAVVQGTSSGPAASGVTPANTLTEDQMYMPSSSNITVPAGTYTTVNQTIQGDPALIAGNIREGATIFNVPGTFTHVIESSTPSASDIRLGKQAYANGNVINGSLPTMSAVTIDGSWIRGNAGIYPSINQQMQSATINFNTSVSGIIPSATVNSNTGKVTVTINGSTPITYNVSQWGFVPAGSQTGVLTYSGGTNFQLPTISASEWTPSTVDQTIDAGKFTTGQQIIKGDPNLIAENIKSGKTIFDITGTFSNEDWVVAQGNYGTHAFTQDSKYGFWRAWNSGKLEYWFSYRWEAFTGSNDQTYSYGGTKTISFSTLYNGDTDYNFQDAPFVEIQIRTSSSALLTAQVIGINTAQISVYVSRYGNNAFPVSYYDLYAIGRWK